MTSHNDTHEQMLIQWHHGIIQKLVDYGDNNTKGVVNDLLCALFKSVTYAKQPS